MRTKTKNKAQVNATTISLRNDLVEARKAKTHQAAAFPDLLKERVLVYAKSEFAKGRNLQQIADELGIGRPLLVYWFTPVKPKAIKPKPKTTKPRIKKFVNLKKHREEVTLKPKPVITTYNLASGHVALEESLGAESRNQVNITIVTPGNYTITLQLEADSIQEFLARLMG